MLSLFHCKIEPSCRFFSLKGSHSEVLPETTDPGLDAQPEQVVGPDCRPVVGPVCGNSGTAASPQRHPPAGRSRHFDR